MDLNEVAKAWVEMWGYEVDDPQRDQYDWVSDYEYVAVYKNPELAIDLVIAILRLNPDNLIKEVLAAGPLEQVLAEHGPSIIARVESEAKKDLQFANLLGGVWQNKMPDEIWERVQKVWNRSGWDGNV